MARRGSSIESRWRVLETTLWEREALDLVVRAHISFGHEGLGELPAEVVAGTRARYVEAIDQFTGIAFADYIVR